MRDPTTLEEAAPQPTVASGSGTREGDFRQIFSRISSRIGGSKARPATSHSLDGDALSSELDATREALSKAHVSLVQIGLQLEAEREKRQAAEEKSRQDQHACREAMQLLEHTVKPLRELKAAQAEREDHADQQKQAYAELEARHRALEEELTSTQQALEREAEAAADLRSRVEGAQRQRSDEQARGNAELEGRLHALEAQLRQTEAALAQAVSVAADMKLQIDAERLAREEVESRFSAAKAERDDARSLIAIEREAREAAEARAEAERLERENAETRIRSEQHAREEAEHALLHVQHAVAEQREAAELQARAQSELEGKLKATELMLAEQHPAHARSTEAIVELERLVESERLGRQEAENRVRAEIKHEVEAHRLRAEEHALAFADLQAQSKAAQTQVKQCEAALARAQQVVQKHVERNAQIVAELEKQLRAREALEAKLKAEREARREAESALSAHDEPQGFFSKLIRGSR
jgi:hypothetical protein